MGFKTKEFKKDLKEIAQRAKQKKLSQILLSVNVRSGLECEIKEY